MHKLKPNIKWPLHVWFLNATQESMRKSQIKHIKQQQKLLPKIMARCAKIQLMIPLARWRTHTWQGTILNSTQSVATVLETRNNQATPDQHYPIDQFEPSCSPLITADCLETTIIKTNNQPTLDQCQQAELSRDGNQQEVHDQAGLDQTLTTASLVATAGSNIDRLQSSQQTYLEDMAHPEQQPRVDECITSQQKTPMQLARSETIDEGPSSPPNAFAFMGSAASDARDRKDEERHRQIKERFLKAAAVVDPHMVTIKGGGLNINNLMTAIERKDPSKHAALVSTLVEGDFDEFIFLETHAQNKDCFEAIQCFLHEEVVKPILKVKGFKDWSTYPIDGPESYNVYGSFYQSIRPLRRSGTVIIVKNKYRTKGWGRFGCRGILSATSDAQGRFGGVLYEDFDCVIMGAYPRNTSDNPNPYILREHHSLIASIATYIESTTADVLLFTDANSSSSWEQPEVYRHPRQKDPIGI